MAAFVKATVWREKVDLSIPIRKFEVQEKLVKLIRKENDLKIELATLIASSPETLIANNKFEHGEPSERPLEDIVIDKIENLFEDLTEIHYSQSFFEAVISTLEDDEETLVAEID